MVGEVVVGGGGEFFVCVLFGLDFSTFRLCDLTSSVDRIPSFFQGSPYNVIENSLFSKCPSPNTVS